MRSPEVKKLAEDIRRAPGPEIRTLSGWLASRGEEAPAEGAMDHSSHGGSGGMMTMEDMDKLKSASGKAFDPACLELMIQHHEGAVAMAKTDEADGAFPDATGMADAIISSRSAEITRMNELLGRGRAGHRRRGVARRRRPLIACRTAPAPSRPT